jgi:hypothetical protein
MADVKFRRAGEAGGLVADRRLYETRDGQICEEGDPEAVALVAAAGQVIPAGTARRLRLSEDGQAAAPAAGEPVPSTVTAAPPAQTVRPFSLTGGQQAPPEPAQEPETPPAPAPAERAPESTREPARKEAAPADDDDEPQRRARR